MHRLNRAILPISAKVMVAAAIWIARGPQPLRGLHRKLLNVHRFWLSVGAYIATMAASNADFSVRTIEWSSFVSHFTANARVRENLRVPIEPRPICLLRVAACCKIACNIDPLRGIFASNSDPF